MGSDQDRIGPRVARRRIDRRSRAARQHPRTGSSKRARCALRTTIACALVCSAACGAPGADATAPLNLVLITLDTTRADALGAYGQPLPSSPTLDRIAAEGARFEYCQSAAPTTLPSHATLFTSQYPFQHGARSNYAKLPTEAQTLAEVLRAHGYRTAAHVAAPAVDAQTGLAQGFETYRDTGGSSSANRDRRLPAEFERSARQVTDGAIEFLEANAHQKYFLWIHYFDPHAPYSAPAEHRESIRDSAYHAEVRYVDAQVARIVAELDALGQRERTLLVVTADHGEGLQEHREPTHAFFVYETTIRVPLLFRGAGIPRGARISTPVRSVDVAPTILDWLGLPALRDAQGVSLVPLLDGSASDLELVAYGESAETHVVFQTSILRYLREGNWKYIHKVEPELYDLSRDPNEIENLAAAHPDLVKRLRARLIELVEAAPTSRVEATAIDQEQAAALQALGYVGAGVPETPSSSSEIDLLALSGDDPSAKVRDVELLGRGFGLIAEKRYAEAVAVLREAHERSPNSVPVLAYLIAAVEELGDEEQHLALLERMVELLPSVEGYVGIAKSQFKRGQHERAERLLHKALALDSCASEPRATLAFLASQRGDQRRRVELLAEGVERCPDSLELKNDYAYALATNPVDSLRDGRRALDIAKEVVNRMGSGRPEFLDTLACAHAESGDFDNAVRSAERALARFEATGNARASANTRRHLEAFREGRPARDP